MFSSDANARARATSTLAARNMRQNLGFAFIYNALGVPIAADVLFPGADFCCRR